MTCRHLCRGRNDMKRYVVWYAEQRRTEVGQDVRGRFVQRKEVLQTLSTWLETRMREQSGGLAVDDVHCDIGA